MTAQRDADVESLRKSAHRPLDVFLVVSVILLFLAVSTVVAFVVIIDSRHRSIALRDEETSSRRVYNKNSVVLEPSSSLLENSTMPLEVLEYGTGTSEGNLFIFDKGQSSLQTKKDGLYFIYIALNLTCTHLNNCTPGRLTVQVGDKLTCEVELRSERQVHRKCWTISKLNKEKLLTQMTVPKTGLTNWRLELNSSELGMFLMD